MSRAGEEDLLGDSAWSAFRSGEAEAWRRYFHENTHRAPADTLVAELDGALAGHLTAMRLELRLGAADVPVRGIAAVAVLPEARRRGVADALVRAILRRMRDRGEPLAALYPFSIPFYRKFGFGVCEWLEILRVAPRRLPASPLRRHVRRLDRARDAAALRGLYDAARDGRHGPLARSDYWWEKRVLARVGDGVVYVSPAGRVEGYLLYDVPDAPAHPAQHCRVKELVHTTPEAWRGLIGFLEALGEQVALVELQFPPGEGPQTLRDLGFAGDPPDVGLYRLGAYRVSGMMARLVDVPAALALHPGPRAARARGSLGLDVDDPVFGKRGYDVHFGAGGAEGVAARKVKDRITLGADRLAEIFLGATRAAGLVQRGLLDGSGRAAALLDRAFTGEPLLVGRMNFF